MLKRVWSEIKSFLKYVNEGIESKNPYLEEELKFWQDRYAKK